MIISVEKLQTIPFYKKMSSEECISKIKAIESTIRSHTNNNFQNKKIRFYASTQANTILGASIFIKKGDTIEISESLNEGLYNITNTGDVITVLEELYPITKNLITKIEYPEDVQEGAFNLLKWDAENRDKVGIKSETISRHSVNYYDQDKNNTVKGYPVALMSFCKAYMRPRF